MPIQTYSPRWDDIADFFEKVSPCLPEGYTGLIAVRLHRTGFPLTIEPLGSEVPDRELYPLALIELRDGEPTRTWEQLETDFEVPWVSERDFHAFRNDVMPFFHAEDHLEPVAEQILREDRPDAALLARAVVGATPAPAGAA